VVKKAAILVLAIVFYFYSVSFSYASLLVIKSNGELTWNVLSEEDSSFLKAPSQSFIEVKKVAETNFPSSTKVSLIKEGDKFSLVALSGNEERKLDVSNWKDNLVEIEERPQIQKLVLGIREGKFTLSQGGVTAETSFSVSVDSEKARISVETPEGQRYVSILPVEAVEVALRTNLMNRISSENIEILERKNELLYSIRGEKVFDFFNVFDYSIPVTIFISASSGKVLDLEAPGWFRFIKFIFV